MRLKFEEYRVKNGGCKIESEELEGVGLRVTMEDVRSLLVTEVRMQNFSNLEQPLHGEK